MNAGGSGRLIVVCGLPGAGKTTHAKRLEAESGAVRFCPDEWMGQLGIDLWDEGRRSKLEAFQWELAQRLLLRGLTIIIEWDTWARCERDALRLGARALGAAVELHYLAAPVETLFERLRRRGTESPPIEYDQLRSWAQRFEAPTPEELATYDASNCCVDEASG